MHHRLHPVIDRFARLLLAAGLLFSLFSSTTASPIGPEMVKDIQSMNGWSLSERFTPVDNAFFFFANDGLHGKELWRSQGTPATTVMVADLVPGSVGIYPMVISRLDGTRIVFGFSGENNTTQIWVSDGTSKGTKLLTSSTGSSFPPVQVPVNMDGLVYLIYGGSLWRTDGTSAGTAQVTDMPLTSDTFAAFNGWLYFSAEGPQGRELYRTNAAAVKPELVKDMCADDCGAGQGNGNPQAITAGVDRLYFVASNAEHGRAVWSTTGTGTPASVTLVADIVNGISNLEAYSRLTPLGSGLYFTGIDSIDANKLFYTTGAAGMANLVADLQGYDISEMITLGGTLFFTTRSRADSSDYALYKTTGSGVERLESVPLYLASFARIDDALYAVGGSSSGEALWKITEDTDPQQVISIRATPFFPQNMIAWKNRLFFSAGDPLHGYELWNSDGSAAGTALLTDLNTIPYGADTEALAVVYQDAIFFKAGSGFNYDMLWRSDGTSTGTRPVSKFSSNLPDIVDAAVSNGLLYFSAEYNGLWRTDGTEQGTVRLLLEGYPRRLMDANGKMFFIANNKDQTGVTALWVMDKGASAPAQVMDPGGMEMQVGVLGSSFLFTTWAPGGWKLWLSNGTPDGTRSIYRGATSGTDFRGYNFNYLEAMAPFDGRLFFAAPAADGSNAAALYATDGVKVTQISAVGGAPLFPTKPVAAGEALYFGGMNGKSTGGTDTVIWKVAKGSSQAQVVHTDAKAVEQIAMDIIPVPLVDLNGKLVFSGENQRSGGLLWTSDGKPGGAKPLCPTCGYAFYSGHRPVVFGGKLYFRAEDTTSQYGKELWVSDGTDSGTRLLADIRPGPDSSDPANLLVLGQQLLFIATDGDAPGIGHGRELWRYNLISSPYTVYLPVLGR